MKLRHILSVAFLLIGTSPESQAKLDIRIHLCNLRFGRVLGKRETERILVEHNVDTRGYFSKYLVTSESGLTDRLKNAVLRNPKTAKVLEDLMAARSVVKAGNQTPVALNQLLLVKQRYNFVITDSAFQLASTSEDPVKDLLSKHYFLASSAGGGNRVRMAGQMWLDEAGSLHFNNSSGTFRPDAAVVQQTARFFREGLGMRFVVSHVSK